MPTILVVDDDPHIREVICFALKNEGFRVIQAEDGRQAVEQFMAHAPDLVVLDILMPEMNGTDVCRTLRRESTTPIVFLSSKDEELDRILGLELGGDDYVTKPFSPRELVARVRAVLRRGSGNSQSVGEVTILRHGRLSMNVEHFKAYWDTAEITLTVTEFGILKTLLSHPGRVFSRDALMDSAYQDPKIVSDRTIDSHVRRVRNKFKTFDTDPIDTVSGLGYKLNDC